MDDYPAMIAPVGHFEPVPRRIRAYLGSEPVEEDEQVFVHPRSPYVRVDALRSTRTVRVELRGTLLAESDSPVLVFETGLPTRYYLSRTAVRFEHLIPTDTQTQSPYKGTTSGYWSARVDGRVHPDLAWTYDFPTRALLPIAGMLAFYNKRVDIVSCWMASVSNGHEPTSDADRPPATHPCSTARKVIPPADHREARRLR